MQISFETGKMKIQHPSGMEEEILLGELELQLTKARASHTKQKEAMEQRETELEQYINEINKCE